jgi:hypothetical protein
MFILRQRLFMITIALASTASIGALWSSVIANGKGTPATLAMMVPIGILCGGGFAVLAVLPAFFVYRWRWTAPPEFRHEPDETVLFSEDANHFLDGEGRGGTLWVTDRRLAFCPHRYNVQLDLFVIEWEAIAGFSTAPPTFLFVERANGTRVRLVAPEREKLAAYLERLRARPASERVPESERARSELGLELLSEMRARLTSR